MRMGIDHLKSQLIEFGRYAHQRSWVPATSGNFSQRVSAEEILITASGMHKGYLSEGDFLLTSLRGETLDPRKPSAETHLHLQLYQHYPAVNCVLHVHTLSATLLADFAAPEIRLSRLELLKAFDGIDTHEVDACLPVVANSQNMQTLAAAVEPYLAQPILPAYLISGHGVYVWGKDYPSAFRHLEALDFLLTCTVAKTRVMNA
jgi:methylthioribulose-1-phosphate dehydratase